MFWIFNLSFDIWATVWATFQNIGRVFAQFSGHSARAFWRRQCQKKKKALDEVALVAGT